MAKSGYSYSNRIRVEQVATSAATKTIDLGKKDCGKHYFITTCDHDITFNLPSSSTEVGEGWNVEIESTVGPSYGEGTTGEGNLTLIKNGDANIQGGLMFADLSAGGNTVGTGLKPAQSGSHCVWNHASASVVCVMSGSDSSCNGTSVAGHGTGYAGTKVRVISLGSNGWLCTGTIVVSSSQAASPGLSTSHDGFGDSGWIAYVNMTPYNRTSGVGGNLGGENHTG